MPVTKMAYSETIVIPLNRVSVLDRARATAVEQIGGFTETHGMGGWKSDDGETHRERIASITVWSNDWRRAEEWVLDVRQDLFDAGEKGVFMASSNDEDGKVAGVFTQ